MKVRMIRNPAAQFECRLVEGEEGNVSTLLGEYLIKANLAVRLDEPEPPKPAKPKEVKAVPDAPAIAEEKPPAIEADEKVEPQAAKADKPETSRPKWRDTKPQSKKES